MQFKKFLSLLQKRGLSYAISRISFSSPKTWTIICDFWNFFLFSNNVDYHMQFLEFLSLLKKSGRFSLLPKHGLSYAIFGISFSSPITSTIICSLRNFFFFFK